MTGSSFFDEQKEQSLIKARIVEKYLWVWAKVVIPTAKKRSPSDPRIAYIDLFAGAGRYKDGSKSTPIKVLEAAISDPDMRNMLVSVFNDADAENVDSLQKSIDLIPNIQLLKHRPQVLNQEVGNNIVKAFDTQKLIPTLFLLILLATKACHFNLLIQLLKTGVVIVSSSSISIASTWVSIIHL